MYDSKKKPLISYILPCYKVEKYIDRCLSSLLGQTYENIEIVCINDKSPDNTVSIIEKYRTLDKRIRLINHEINKGVSAARNTGILAAKGSFIAILDPDDWLDSTRTKNLIDVILSENPDIIADDVISDYENGKKSRLEFNIKDKILVDFKEFALSNVPTVRKTKRYGLMKPIIRKNVILDNNIFYNENLKFSEDFDFYMRLLDARAKLIFTKFEGYHYIKRDGSATDISKSSKCKEVLDVNEILISKVNPQNQIVLRKRERLISRIKDYYESKEKNINPLKKINLILFIFIIQNNIFGSFEKWKNKST